MATKKTTKTRQTATKPETAAKKAPGKTKPAASAKPALTIAGYHRAQTSQDRAVCALLEKTIRAALPEAEAKVWHAHPVWFLAGNPIVGYSKLKGGVRLLFWSGRSFDTPGLSPEGTFKAAEARYVTASDVDLTALRAWLKESRLKQWDYANIMRKRRLDPLVGVGP